MALTLTASAREIGGALVKGAATRAARWARDESFVDPGSLADAALLADDIGWIPSAMAVSSTSQANELSPYERVATVRRARLYYVQDAMCKQSIRLYTAYTVGRGLSIKARDYKPTPRAVQDNPDAGDFADEVSDETLALQKEADDFWEHPDNSPVFSTESQAKCADKLNVDGELFYVLMPPIGDTVDENGELVAGDTVTRVRLVKDCLQIVAIFYNPEDDSEPWYYLRQWQENGETKRRLYPDHRLFLRSSDGPEGERVVKLPKPPENALTTNAKVMTAQYIYHQKVNTISERGNSLLTPVMPWAKVNRLYLEDRATISRAHARIAWKRIIKGPASAIAAFGKRAISGTTAGSAPGAVGLPIPPMAGQTLNVNSGQDWESVNAQDGGKNAYIESRNFRLMFYAGVGFAEHYFGDGSNGTRATSTQMERPTELTLQAFQHILKGGYEEMFAFHLSAIGHQYDAHAVWVDAPQILEDDTATVISSILSVIGVLPEFDIDEIIIRMLNAFQIDDPQDVLVKIRARQKQLYEQYLELVYAQNGLDPATMGDVDMNDPTALTKLVAAQQKVISMLTPVSNTTEMPGPKKPPQFGQGGLGATLRQRKPTPSGTRPTTPIAAA